MATDLADRDIAERLNLPWRLREAGDVTLQYFRRSDLQVDRKADQSPVTVADRSAEELLRERIWQTVPSRTEFIGEEFGEQRGYERVSSGFSIRSTARNRLFMACRCTRRSSRCCAMGSRKSA